ncbi:alpha/beta fold hydrolase [Streptomyces erythrochromogenes]|uniref:alpha/beta fold hydrolase n=1 Tax=Streptomyces erythrochromogenes TaxID=285574 RepID=UPI00363CC7B2
MRGQEQQHAVRCLALPHLPGPRVGQQLRHRLGRLGRTDAQADLAFDYASDFAHYPAWQAWLRSSRVPVLVVWGAGDPFFTPAGAKAYLRDAPDADVHVFEGAGHFALETHLPQTAPLIEHFLRTLP